MLIAAVIAATLASSATPQPSRSPALARRADSLAALDPARELAKALRRGDRRYLGVCGYTCKPPGLTLGELSELRPGQIRPISGTSDAIENQDVARLNRVAHAYAERYNGLLRAQLRRASPRRPAT